MAYIGQGLPADVFAGFTIDKFTGTGVASQTLTLSKAPLGETALLVTIDGVVQEPTDDFTVSGTTVTLVGTAPLNSEINVTHLSGTVPNTLASAVDVNGLSDGIILDADADTTISADTDDQIDFKAGGTDTLFVTNGKVGITNAPDLGVGLHIKTADTSGTVSTNADELVIEGTRSGMTFLAANDDFSYINFGDDGGADRGSIRYSHASDALTINTGATEVASFHTDGIVFNEGNNDQNFRVEGDGNINLLFVDAGVDSIYINASAQISDEKFLVNNNDNSKGTISRCTSGSQVHDTVHFDANRAGSSAYNFVRIQSGNFSDSEFILTGEGNAYADGSWNGGGADYAEYFEWKDGNTSDEDRVGCSVVLDGNKIVKATDSDDASKIIGVISANPAVTGDSDIEQWLHKYERDELNRFIWEDYESVIWFDEKNKDTFYHVDRVPDGVTIPDDAIYYRTEDDGVTKLKRKKLNPAYDESKTYVSRKDRKEWDTVGLMGKLRIKKGQPTGTNWIKMRDISETIEEWLVR